MYYHVTPTSNLASIFAHGLKPSIGKRSAELGEKTPRVYMFENSDDVEDALGGWLGDSFDENIELSILLIAPQQHILYEKEAFEITCKVTIKPDTIMSVTDENFNIIDLEKMGLKNGK